MFSRSKPNPSQAAAADATLVQRLETAIYSESAPWKQSIAPINALITEANAFMTKTEELSNSLLSSEQDFDCMEMRDKIPKLVEQLNEQLQGIIVISPKKPKAQKSNSSQFEMFRTSPDSISDKRGYSPVATNA